MGYENAPATKMLATHCACCGKDLLDAKSVEIGMGPVCRKKHGYNVQVSEDARKQANVLIYQIALERSQGAVTLSALVAAAQLDALGFTALSALLIKRLADVRLVETNGEIAIFAPYNDNAVSAFRMLPGRKWDKDAKCNRIPATAQAKTALLGILRTYYPGMLAIGSKGPFTL